MFQAVYKEEIWHTPQEKKKTFSIGRDYFDFANKKLSYWAKTFEGE